MPEEMGVMAPGTPLPESLQASTAHPVLQVTQSSINTLPTYTLPDILALQEADPMIKQIWPFWRQNRWPTAEQRSCLSHPTLQLLRQWDRLVEKDKVLHCRIFHSDGGEEIP